MKAIKFLANLVLFAFAVISTLFMLHLVVLALQMRP